MNHLRSKAGVHLLTVETLDGYEVEEYYGLVSSEVVLGANFVKDFFASIGDLTGGRIRSYENVLKSAKERAVLQMSHKARDLGANAIIAIDIKVVNLSARLISVSCYGTAVHLELKKELD